MNRIGGGTKYPLEKTELSYISSCNIACGSQVGSKELMSYCLLMAHGYGVLAGAIPSYPDTNYFGHRSLFISSAELKNSLHIQLSILPQVRPGEKKLA